MKFRSCIRLDGRLPPQKMGFGRTAAEVTGAAETNNVPPGGCRYPPPLSPNRTANQTKPTGQYENGARIRFRESKSRTRIRRRVFGTAAGRRRSAKIANFRRIPTTDDRK